VSLLELLGTPPVSEPGIEACLTVAMLPHEIFPSPIQPGKLWGAELGCEQMREPLWSICCKWAFNFYETLQGHLPGVRPAVKEVPQRCQDPMDLGY
jgi:hypothetical protein